MAFLDGLPRRYLALFGLATIYRHVRLARDIGADEVHASLEKHDDIWELSVVTLDKPFLFSNISGVLSYFGMDIHRGQAMTTPGRLVLDVFEFSDDEEFLRAERRPAPPRSTACSRRSSPARSTSPRCCAARSAACSTAAAARCAPGHPLRQRALRRSTPSRNRRRRRDRACCTASAASCRGTAAMSISC